MKYFNYNNSKINKQKSKRTNTYFIKKKNDKNCLL